MYFDVLMTSDKEIFLDQQNKWKEKKERAREKKGKLHLLSNELHLSLSFSQNINELSWNDTNEEKNEF